MRNIVMVMAVCLACCSAASGQPQEKRAEKLSVTLNLKDKAAEPVNPKNAFPEITYTKLPDCAVADAAWVVEIDVVEDGKVKTHSTTAGDEKIPNETLVPIPGHDGTFTGKDGRLQQTVSLYLTFFKVSGKGTMRLALVDSEDFITKQKAGNAKNARKLSNWLEIPIQIDDVAGENPRVQAAAAGAKRTGKRMPEELKKGDPATNKEVGAGDLLGFICAKEEAWSMDQIPLSESVANPVTKATKWVSASEAQQAELARRMAWKDPWGRKLLMGIDYTPLYLRISCRKEDQLLITDVIAKFGEPDRKQTATINTGRFSSTAGEWHYYGPVRLGVTKEGRILSVQIDSPNWRALCETMDQAAAAVADKKAAPKQPQKDLDPEAKAASQLSLAKTLQKPNPAAAKRRLEQIIIEFPNTKAANEAKLHLAEE